MRPQDHRPFAPFAVLALGVAAFSVMDAIMKGLTLALGAYNAIFWRLIVALPISGVLYATARAGRPTRAAMKLHALRGAVNAASAVTFFWGLARMPLAEGVAISFVAPIIALFLAALLLGERIGQGAVLASLLGISGVIVILWPQIATPGRVRDLWGAASILLAAALYAYNLILLRQQAQIAGPQEVTFFQNLVITLCLLVFAPLLAQAPSVPHLPMLIAAAVLVSAANLLFAWAYRRAEAQHLAPLEYSALLWAAILGYGMFGEAIRPTTIAGAALIIAGCSIAARSGRRQLSPAEAVA